MLEDSFQSFADDQKLLKIPSGPYHHLTLSNDGPSDHAVTAALSAAELQAIRDALESGGNTGLAEERSDAWSPVTSHDEDFAVRVNRTE